MRLPTIKPTQATKGRIAAVFISYMVINVLPYSYLVLTTGGCCVYKLAQPKEDNHQGAHCSGRVT